MSTDAQPKKRKKLKSTSGSTVIGVAMVLFMLGMLGLLLVTANSVSSYVKENIRLQVFFKADATEEKIQELQHFLTKTESVREVVLLSKEQAAEQLQADLGEDFISFLGYNPLTASADVFFNADYANAEQIQKLAGQLSTYSAVDDVIYSPDLIEQINTNTAKIGLVLLAFSGLLLIICVALINNTIRLAIYSKRYLIKTMQLVGATTGFIRKPFVYASVIQGIVAAILAGAGIVALLSWMHREYPELIQATKLTLYIELFGLLALMGIFISYICTYFAVRKYTRYKIDDII